MTDSTPLRNPPDYTLDPDVVLLLEAKKGDRASFEALLRKYFGRIFNFNYRFLGSREIAEDLTQEVFLRVYRSLPSYQPQAKFQTWIYTIARNLCLNEVRKNKQRFFSLEDALESQDGEIKGQFGDPSAANPSEELQGKEQGVLIRQAVDSLPENQRTAVILQRYEGLSYDEIAATLGCSVPAVKSLLNRAKESLRTKLAGMRKKD